jgi:hypothetical protein
MASLQNFLAYVDDPDNQTNFKNRLRDAVAYKRFVVLQWHHTGLLMLDSVATISVSSDPTRRQELKDMGTWLENRLRDYGVDTKQVDLNKIVHPVPTPDLPNLILGKIDGPPGNNLKTVLVYGHYDVQPVSGISDQSSLYFRHKRIVYQAKPDDAWETEDHDPFKLNLRCPTVVWWVADLRTTKDLYWAG